MSSIRIQTVVSQAGRKIVGRLLPGSDLIKGIEEICRHHDVSGASILSVIGSLKKATIVYAITDDTRKIGIRYSDPARIEGPLELLACQGMIGQTEDGQLITHLHGLISDPQMTVYGGHFIEDGNPVLATAEILLQECRDVQLIKKQDAETGFPLFTFHPDGGHGS